MLPISQSGAKGPKVYSIARSSVYTRILKMSTKDRLTLTGKTLRLAVALLFSLDLFVFEPFLEDFLF